MKSFLPWRGNDGGVWQSRICGETEGTNTVFGILWSCATIFRQAVPMLHRNLIREILYKTLRKDCNPEFATILKVLCALDLKIVTKAV